MRTTDVRSRIVGIAAFAIFALFAAVQYNDPDPLPWMLAYGYAAIIALMVALRVDVRLAATAGAVGFAVAAWRLYPAEIPGRWIDSEEAREAAGLALCFVWAVYAACGQRRASTGVETSCV